ncbi:MAG TPA: FAD-dependent oxidoreductase, partial [Gemmataceae bacterium]|nr:FAD-dependent oxidoreductase [Gemmataceae bacterium]
DLDNGASHITLVCDEPAYARMVLPYWIAGRIPRDQVFTADDAYYQRLKVEWQPGRVARIDPKAKTATLQDGKSLPFDDVLIATGSRAVVPPIPGADLPGVHPLWTLAHTEAVLRETQGLAKPEVVLVGAGFIGFIVLNAMYKRGWKLHVVEMADHVLPRMLDADSARLVEKWLERRGVGLHLGTTVRDIAPLTQPSPPSAGGEGWVRGNGRKQVTTADGRRLTADLVIVATGIRPNLDLVAGSGIATDQGILVNDRMQTNFPFVYAAGDVAQGPDLLGDRPAVHAIQPTAVDHGRIAGANMAGQDVRYPGSLLMNILDACGLQCASFGRWSEAPAEAMTIRNPDRPVYRKLLWTGDEITGAIFIGPANDLGMLNDVGMVKGIMQTRTHLGPWKEYLRHNPFDVRRAYVAAKVAQKLAGTTLLGRPSKARQYRFAGEQPAPQVTRPQAHKDFVGTKA